MATIFRAWSYRHPRLYNSISLILTSLVGGQKRFHLLPFQGIDLDKNDRILDLCCGGGQATQYLIHYSPNVTGLDLSPVVLKRAAKLVPDANYVEGLAEKIPLPDSSFDLVYCSVALHEMSASQLSDIFQEVFRVLSVNGQFVFLDLHRSSNPLIWFGLQIFLFLFETETAWELTNTDLIALLDKTGFQKIEQKLYAGGGLQVIQCQR